MSYSQSIKILLVYFIFFLVLGCQQEPKNQIKVGIVVPLEHTAMTAIVDGFVSTLKQVHPNKSFQFHIANAQGDPNLMRAIIQQMRAEGAVLIVPIGTSTTQMTLAMTDKQNVVSLAAEFSESERQKQSPCHSAFVHDEISAKQLVDFVHAAYPNVTRLTLIHSPADKIFPEVKAAIAEGKKQGITITPMMINALPDLYLTGKSMPKDTQAILILKDHLLVSGTPTLAKMAAERHIPLISSDEGSVQQGASFALGVHERDIGVEGAKIAAQVLSGKSICDIPIVEMNHLTVFLNQKSLDASAQKKDSILEAANKFDYAHELVGGSS